MVVRRGYHIVLAFLLLHATALAASSSSCAGDQCSSDDDGTAWLSPAALKVLRRLAQRRPAQLVKLDRREGRATDEYESRGVARARSQLLQDALGVLKREVRPSAEAGGRTKKTSTHSVALALLAAACLDDGGHGQIWYSEPSRPMLRAEVAAATAMIALDSAAVPTQAAPWTAGNAAAVLKHRKRMLKLARLLKPAFSSDEIVRNATHYWYEWMRGVAPRLEADAKRLKRSAKHSSDSDSWLWRPRSGMPRAKVARIAQQRSASQNRAYQLASEMKLRPARAEAEKCASRWPHHPGPWMVLSSVLSQNVYNGLMGWNDGLGRAIDANAKALAKLERPLHVLESTLHLAWALFRESPDGKAQRQANKEAAMAASQAEENWKPDDLAAYQKRVARLDSDAAIVDDSAAPAPVLIFTYANRPKAELEALRKSAKDHGHELVVIGMGDKDFDRVGLIQKLHVLRAEIAARDLAPSQLVLFTDAYDVLVLCDPNELERKFLSLVATDGVTQRDSISSARSSSSSSSSGSSAGAQLPHAVVIGAEKNCFPRQPLCDQHPTSPRSPGYARGYKYLNSGTFMGRAADIAALLATLDANQVDDQMHMMNVMADPMFNVAAMNLPHGTDIVLDFDQSLFQTLHAVPVKELAFHRPEARFRNSATQQQPCVLHGNGDDGKLFYRRVAANLGYLEPGV